MVFDPTILEVLQDSITTVQEVVEEAGASFGSRHRVTMVSILKPTSTEDFGFQGAPSQTEQQPIYDEMSPQPVVEIKDQVRFIDGQLVNIGDARLKNIVMSRYTRDDLIAANYFLVSGDKYDLVKGSVKESSGGIFLECVLKRMEQEQGKDYGP